jgi:hypothetical protein
MTIGATSIYFIIERYRQIMLFCLPSHGFLRGAARNSKSWINWHTIAFLEDTLPYQGRYCGMHMLVSARSWAKCRQIWGWKRMVKTGNLPARYSVNAEAAEDPCLNLRSQVPGSAPWKRSFRPDIGTIQYQAVTPPNLKDRDKKL